MYFETEGGNERRRGGRDVGHAQLGRRHGRLGVAVRVVDERVEALVDPLPEHHRRHRSRPHLYRFIR